MIIVALAGVAIYALNRNDHMPDNDMMPTSQPSDNSMADKNSADYKMYSQLRGDDYDRMFIANMIAHHQGAVDMAKLAQANAQHQEIKDLATAIIAAQTKEITDMQAWQQQWGYPASSGDMMMDHSAMDTMDTMTHMSDSLKTLTGDAFDKAFLAAMIIHHQSAINMSEPGQTNAKHDEIKTLTKAVVEAQSREVTQMKQWQSARGY